MKMYVRNGLKILADYGMVLVVFVIFLYPFLGLTKDSLYVWLPLYSAVFFIFAFAVIYADMKELAKKEKKPQYDLKPHPFKGAIYGFVSIVPVAVLVLVGSLLRFSSFSADRLRHVLVNIILGPFYFLYRALNESLIGYTASMLLLPLIAMLGYLAGFYGIDIFRKISGKKKEVQERPFTKSPWNPTNNTKKSSGKKKKKTNE